MPISAVNIRTIYRSTVDSSLLGLAKSALDECKAGSSSPRRFRTQVLDALPFTLRCADEVDLGTNSNSLLVELMTLA
jgi:hypothetical protein